MEQIILSEHDIKYLHQRYPKLIISNIDNSVKGKFEFCRSHNGKTIKANYSIEFKLEYASNSVLPIVRETENKILKIAKRKMLPLEDLHLNSQEGHLCLILPIKEREVYPEGFDLEIFMDHLETYFYWITYFDRYNEKPWDDEPHLPFEALLKAAKESKIYRKDLKKYIENKLNRELNRVEFRQILRKWDLL